MSETKTNIECAEQQAELAKTLADAGMESDQALRNAARAVGDTHTECNALFSATSGMRPKSAEDLPGAKAGRK